MSNVLQKENIIMSLPHRDWSCEVIECRLKVCPVPDELDRGNNIFFTWKTFTSYARTVNHLTCLDKFWRNVSHTYHQKECTLCCTDVMCRKLME